MTRALIAVVALTASLSANATPACCMDADVPDASEPARAYDHQAQPASTSGSGPTPTPTPASLASHGVSPSDDEVRAAGSGTAAPVADRVQRLALSALAEHSARAMGAESATVLGLDAAALPLAVSEARPAAPAVAGDQLAPRQASTQGVDIAASRLSGASRPVARVPTPYDGLIEEAATQHAVSAELVRAVVKVESNFQPHARSPKGAIGLMQVMPATGRRFGAVDLHDPRTNIQAGTRYLRWLLTRFGDDMTLALAAYNAGEGAVEKHGRQVPPYAETRDYVGKVLGHLYGSYGATASRATAASNGPATSSPANPPAPSPTAANAPRGNGTLDTVATWMGALLTSAYRPRATSGPAAAEAMAVAASHGGGVRVADAFSAGPR